MAELRGIAALLAKRAPQIEPAIAAIDQGLAERLSLNAHPAEAELALETYTRDLRAIWLRFCAAEAARAYRSPTQGQIERLEHSCHDSFGYERDLRPETLEGRAQRFYPAPPDGWRAQHLLFSSGQAAMTIVLAALGREIGHPMQTAHFGAYFETEELINALPALARLGEQTQKAELAILEPIYCDG